MSGASARRFPDGTRHSSSSTFLRRLHPAPCPRRCAQLPDRPRGAATCNRERAMTSVCGARACQHRDAFGENLRALVHEADTGVRFAGSSQKCELDSADVTIIRLDEPAPNFGCLRGFSHSVRGSHFCEPCANASPGHVETKLRDGEPCVATPSSARCASASKITRSPSSPSLSTPSAHSTCSTWLSARQCRSDPTSRTNDGVAQCAAHFWP